MGLPRRVRGLCWARPVERPASIPTGRPRGTKAEGMRFERAVRKALPMAVSGQWFEYWDANGHGWCSPDLILHLASGIVVLECKLTDKEYAQAQVKELYVPVLECAYSRPVRGVIVARNITRNSQLVFPTLREALGADPSGPVPVVHALIPRLGHL